MIKLSIWIPNGEMPRAHMYKNYVLAYVTHASLDMYRSTSNHDSSAITIYFDKLCGYMYVYHIDFYTAPPPPRGNLHIHITDDIRKCVICSAWSSRARKNVYAYDHIQRQSRNGVTERSRATKPRRTRLDMR
jgi:hypothetical protein